jgi:6-phospho-beta-glucosidase
MRLAVVGAGSTYTPELVSGLDRLPVERLALHDIDGERLGAVAGLARRMLGRQGFGGELVETDDLALALEGADAVVIQIRVGGQAQRLLDETVPLECGCIGQETTGAGGFAKALRTVPVVLEIAERVRTHASPEAWIVDFTNPVGIVTRALLDAGHRAVGLCNVNIGFQREFARLLGVAPERVLVDQVGLNHLTWVRAVLLDGRDVLPELIADHGNELAEHVGLPRRTLDALGAVPSYYLRYFYEHDRVLAEERDGVPRAVTVGEIEEELLAMYRDPALSEKPPLLEQRGGAFYSEAALGLLAALVSGTQAVHVVDLRSGGAVRGLADDDVVEIPARFGAGDVEPLPQAPLAPELLGLVQHVAAYERLAAEAARTGHRSTALKALLVHPLIGQLELAEELLEKLLTASSDFLPQFSAKGLA